MNRARQACLEVAKRQLQRAKTAPRPMTVETILPTLTSRGKAAREVAELFATMNARTNQNEVRFWAGMVRGYTEEPEA